MTLFAGKERTVEEVLKEMEDYDKESKKNRKDTDFDALDDQEQPILSPKGTVNCVISECLFLLT